MHALVLNDITETETVGDDRAETEGGEGITAAVTRRLKENRLKLNQIK